MADMYNKTICEFCFLCVWQFVIFNMYKPWNPPFRGAHAHKKWIRIGIRYDKISIFSATSQGIFTKLYKWVTDDIVKKLYKVHCSGEKNTGAKSK